MEVSKKVYNIPAWLPFAKILVQHLLEQTKDTPEELTRYRLLLPTRRTCRIVRETFLDENKGAPLLLPQMTALGDVDEEELSLMMFGNGGAFLDVPSAISPLKRQLLLAKLICGVPEFAQGMDHALKLARALSRFIDQVIVEDLDFAQLHKIVPDKFSEHWQITLSFLKIISENWPKILQEQGLVDAAQHRNLLLHALAEHWQDNPPGGHIIAAGSSGSIPAAAKLLRVISSLDNGMVILPGLDHDMDEVSWDCIEDNHPQHSLKTLLQRIGIERSDVNNLMNIEDDQKGSIRHKLASAMMLPAQTTHLWQDFARTQDFEAMTDGLEYYVCSTQQEEAGLVSLIMRETLRSSGKVCALVTPDRALARRVKGACNRWGIEVDDSAGINLCETAQGRLALLVLEAAKKRFDPVAFLSVLKSKLCCLAYENNEVKSLVRELEIEVLRKRYIIASHEKLLTLVNENDDISPDLKEFVGKFYDALKPILDIANTDGGIDAADLLTAHITSMEALSSKHDEDSSSLWSGDAGRSAAQFFANVIDHSYLVGEVGYEEYIQIITSLMRDVTMRVPYGSHPRLLILGQLEARLTKADVIILGGVNEGVWPPETKHDPWMSRPMRSDFGLPAQEQMIGFAAHDFVQGFCGSRVVITRSEKVDGSPTLPARWLDRLETILEAGGKPMGSLSVRPYLQWVRGLDEDPAVPYKRPEPRPPLNARPRGISVTKVDTWLKDPYSIYAYYVLKLRKLPPLRQDNDAALKGTLLHKILEKFAQAFPKDLPNNAQAEFLRIAKETIEQETQDRALLYSWWPKIVQIADWYIAQEGSWRNSALLVATEIKGNVDIDINGEPFNLYGVADRVDKMGDGYALIDYKSGGTFSAKALNEGKYPQLPLEAMILAGGGFDGRGFKRDVALEKDADKNIVAAGETSYMGYWKMNGGTLAGQVTMIDGDVNDTISVVREGLEGLVLAYRNPETPYYCLSDQDGGMRYNDYELISRVKEWSVVDDSDASAGEQS